VLAIALVSISLAGLKVDLGQLFSVVSFGALTASSVVNLSVVKHFWLDKAPDRNVLIHLVLPLIGFALTVWLWTSLSGDALKVGLIWLVVGIAWLGVITRGFRSRPPQVTVDL